MLRLRADKLNSPETLPGRPLTKSHATASPRVLGLVVVWSYDEPHLVGATLLVPVIPSHLEYVFGRAPRGGQPSPYRLSLVRQRPGQNTPIGFPQCERISRRHLLFSFEPDGRPRVAATGQLPLLLNSYPVSEARLHLGDILEIERELMFLCVERPWSLPDTGSSSSEPGFDFGEADEAGMVGESPALWQLRSELRYHAHRKHHLLIVGPSGAGKERAVRALHTNSEHRGRPLVARDATSIPEGLAASELFGNRRGYPNAELPERKGLIGEADGTILFLDELGHLSETLQRRLLRVMETGEYQRLGDEAVTRKSRFRMVGATNKPGFLIPELSGRLRATITVPSLDARREDIPLLVRHLLASHAAEQTGAGQTKGGRSAQQVTARLMYSLLARTYPKNVRGLEAALIECEQHSQTDRLDLSFPPNSEPGPPHAKQGAPALQLPPRRPPPEIVEEPSASILSGGLVRAQARIEQDMERSTPAAAPPKQGGVSIPLIGRDSRENNPWSDLEQERLSLLRRHRFKVSDCLKDPGSTFSESALYRHQRQLIARALCWSQLEEEYAVWALVGSSTGQTARTAGRKVRRWQKTLLARLEQYQRDTHGSPSDEGAKAPISENALDWSAFSSSIEDEYGTYTDDVLWVARRLILGKGRP